MANRPEIDLASFVQKHRLLIAAGLGAALIVAFLLWGTGSDEPVPQTPETPSDAVKQSADDGPGPRSPDEPVEAETGGEPPPESEDEGPLTAAPDMNDIQPDARQEETETSDANDDLRRLATLPRRPNLPADDPRTHGITVLRGLDKITAEITEIELPAGEPVQFGSLSITARACWSRPPEEPPESYAFLEIDDTAVADGDKRVFTGWMMASSPALNSLEHPIYDVWVINCKTVEPEASSGSE